MAKMLQIALRTLGCLVIAGLTLELCARTEDRIAYGAPFFGNYNMDSLYTYDGLGKYGKPNSSYLKWHLNEFGYRGPALRAGAYRIACMGSSETFGLYESAENEWPRQLERMLNAVSREQPKGPDYEVVDYEVVDVAFAGMSMGTSLRRLPQVMRDVKPKMVVIYPSYTAYVDRAEPEPWPEPPGPPKGLMPPPAEHFEWRLSGRIDTLVKTTVPERLQNDVRAWQMERGSRDETVLNRLPQANVDAFTTDLQHLVQALEADGVTVILVTHANRFGRTVAPEDAPVLTAWRKFYPTLTEQGLLDMEARMSDAVRAVGAEDHVAVVDAANLVAPGGRNFEEFVHFTDAGARSLAGLVAGEIEHEDAAGAGTPAPGR